MDLKTSSEAVGPHKSFDEDLPPPSYDDPVSSFPITSSSSSSSQYYSSQISTQLQSLTSQITSRQTQRNLLAHAQEEKILAVLTTHIRTYLSDFASTGLQRGSLILVPANGLNGKNAVPMDYDFRNAEEYDRVVRVRGKEDDGSTWYWEDDEMAERLAGCLRPRQELPPRKEATPQKQEGRSFWGRKKAVKPALIGGRNQKEGYEKGSGDRVVFDVKTEEVCFRSGNEFGIYESESGWAIVLHLQVELARR